jgi:glutamate synthase domain-containing protein 3
MIVIQKQYWFFALFCILTIILMYVLRSIPNRHINFNSTQIAELHNLSAQGNATAISKLINYYLINKDTDKAIEILKQYKDVSRNFKKGYYRFLTERTSNDKDEMISIATELASDGDYYTQTQLITFYTNGWFVKQDLQKAAYWTKIAECNKKGIDIKNCELLKGKE